MPSDAPLVLGFDTSAAHCAAALVRDGETLAARFDPMARGQAEHLFALIDDVLTTAGAAWRDLDLIGVGTGPGNFTGIRISVAAARGLALSLGVRAIGISRFEAQAIGHPRPVWSLIDAPRDRLYACCLSETGSEAPQLLDAADARDAAARQVAQTGIPAIGPGGTQPPPLEEIAIATAMLAARRRDQPGPRPAPLYVRPADAAPPKDAPPAILPA